MYQELLLKALLLSYLFFLCWDLTASVTLTRIVQTRFGKLQGFVKPVGSSRHLKPVDVFLGVPYATPPVGSNRFSPTRTVAPWSGVKLADKVSPVCPQKLPDISNSTLALRRMPKGRLLYLRRILPFLHEQSEDCLYLNIYAPAKVRGNTDKYPVLVYIHGEDYTWGSGNSFDGSVMASYLDVLVVTLNYRLGVLGFLNTNIAPDVRPHVANYGLMDQIAALHWIQQNIALFGGDETNVTLVGHSTGAACIHFLAISPAVTAGLFHRAILLSGSALSTWAVVEDPVYYASRLARQLNCTLPEDLYREHEYIVDCLREVALEDIIAADITSPAFLNSFGPSVDGVVVKPDYRQDASSHFHQGHVTTYNNKRSSDHVKAVKRYDLLFGVVTCEALWRFSASDIQAGFDGERRDKILRTYVRNAYTYHLSEIFVTIVNEYTDWERTVVHPINTRDATVSALSDAQFVAPVVNTGDVFSAMSQNAARDGASSAPRVYFYVFDYQSRDGDYPQRIGAVHGEELPYIFGAPLVEGLGHFRSNFTKSETALSESILTYIGNFARTGNPNSFHKQELLLSVSKERNRFRSIQWDEYDFVHQKYLEIGLKPKMKNHFRSHQLSIWLRLIPELHRAGMEDVIARHNLFHNHHNSAIYDGPIRPDMSNKHPPHQRGHLLNGTVAEVILPITTMETMVTTCVTLQLGTWNSSSDSIASLEAVAAYSTALNVTIAIGCSLLVLNILIFAGVYYQRDKTRLEIKSLQQQKTMRNKHFPTSTSVIVDMDRDTSTMVLTHNSPSSGTLTRFVNNVLKPRQTLVTARHIPKSMSTNNCTELKNISPNGSTTQIPKPPPPPKCKSPPDSQVYYQLDSRTYCHTLPKSALKVPAAAISEMRV